MTPQQILIVAVRLFAIFWFVTSIGHLVAAVRALGHVATGGSVSLALGIPIAELTLCVFLWLFPATLGRRLLKSEHEPPSAAPPALLEWQAMLVAVLGLWTLSNAIPDGAYFFAYFLNYKQFGATFNGQISDQWPFIAATVAEFAIGIWLLLGARGLAELLHRMRTAGIRS